MDFNDCFIEKALKDLMKKIQSATKTQGGESTATATELQEGRQALSAIFKEHSIDEAKNKTFYEEIFNWRFKQ
jgi:hypothetical protein